MKKAKMFYIIGSIVAIFIMLVIAIAPLKPVQHPCLPPNHLYILGDYTSGYHIEGKNGEWIVLTNVLDVQCHQSDPELRKYAR